MIITTKVTIDLQKPAFPAVVNAVQGDQNTRCLEAAFYSGGVSWEIPADAVISMRYCKPDGTKGYYDTMPDGTIAATVSDNTVSMLLAPQMLTVPGSVMAQLEIIQGIHLLGTFSFLVSVEANPAAGVVESEDYINWLQWMETELADRMNTALASGDFTGPQGPQGTPGTPASLVKSEITYQAGDSGTIIPSGTWSSSIPVVTPGKYLWTRQVIRFNTGDPITTYSVARFGIDGSGAVSTVAGIAPDSDGNVPLTAADVEALPTAGGTMTGPIGMNGQKLSGLNAPTTDDEAATKGYADEQVASAKDYADEQVKNAGPYNYAHNSDFTQFIAQAGIGGEHGTQAYAGDRWILDSGTVTGDAREDGNGYTNITLNGTIRQIVENAPAVGTAAVEMVSGTADVSYANGEITITSNGGVIKNVRLFEGNWPADKMSVYQPKGYGAELAECLWYFERLDFGNISNTPKTVAYGYYAGTTTDCRVTFRFTQKRIVPTITSNLSDYGTVCNGQYGTVSDIAIGNATVNVSYFYLTTSACTARTAAVMYGTGTIDISADF